MNGEDVMASDDAWQQLHDLWERFYTTVDIRDDLRVEALGTERAVRLSIAYDRNEDLIRRWHTAGDRNVSTMRELGVALLDACDFVEKVNPVWASHSAPLGPIQIEDGVQ